jgi:excisionase family DNA binding protein
MDKLLTLKQVASTLGLSTKTISRYIESGKLKASKFGNRWRIKPEEVDKFIKGQEQN